MRRFLPYLALLAAAIFVAAWFEGRRPAPPRAATFPEAQPPTRLEPALAAPALREATAEARLDGGEVRLVDGRHAARGVLWFDEIGPDGELLRERKAAIRDGRYRFEGPRAARLAPRGAELQGAPAIVVAPLAPFDPGAPPPLVELRLLEPWRLHVVSAADGADLEGVEVWGLQARDGEGLLVPRARHGVVRDARSPVVLPDPPRRRWHEPATAWVRAPGHAFGRIDLVRSVGEQATLALEPACTLVVDGRALAEAPFAEFVVTRHVQGRAQVVARAPVADEIVLEGLAPGDHSVDAAGPGVVATLRATLAPGATSRLVFARPEHLAPPRAAVALRGSLRVHPSWMDKPRRFAFARVGGGRADRAPLGVPERGLGGWVAGFDLLVGEGEHELLVDGAWPVARIVAPDEALQLELAPRVRTSFVGAEQATLELRLAEGPHDWRVAAPGAASLDLPEGEWALRSAPGSAATIKERRVRLVAPEQVVVLEATPRSLVRATLSRAGRARPFESHWQAWIFDETGGSIARLEPDPRDGWMSAVALAPEGRRLAIAPFMVDGLSTATVRIEPLLAGEARSVDIEVPR